LVINGPASADYDVDAGTILLNDWPHQTADELFWVAQVSGPPTLTNALINGTNVYGSGDSQTGERFTLKVEEDTSYRLRLINGALDTHFKFMIDNHTLTVIAMDLVTIEPFEATSVSLAMGELNNPFPFLDKTKTALTEVYRPTLRCNRKSQPSLRGRLILAPRNPTTSLQRH
jgi:FtsP/CotA-like multicopper oxidase with cupredoxin domain